MPFAPVAPFSVENSSAGLLRFPPWAGDPCQRHRSTPFHHKSFSHSSAEGTIFLSGSRGGMLAVFAEFASFGVIFFRQQRSARIALGMTPFAVVLISLLVWLGGKELTARVGSISQEARGEISGRDASLDLQGWHPHVWPSSSFGLGLWDFSCRIPSHLFRILKHCDRTSYADSFT
jgi:hypothetical protein